MLDSPKIIVTIIFSANKGIIIDIKTNSNLDCITSKTLNLYRLTWWNSYETLDMFWATFFKYIGVDRSEYHGLSFIFICVLTDRFADPWSEHDPVIWRINQVSIVESHYIKISIRVIFNLTPLIPHFIKVSVTSLHSTLFQWRTNASFESDARSHAINMTSNSRWYLFDVFIMHKYLK